MKPTILTTFDIPEAWYRCLWELSHKHSTKPYLVERGSFQGVHKRYELDFLMLHIEKPGARPMVPEIPAGMHIPNPTYQDYIDQYFAEYIMSPEVSANEQYTYGSRVNQSLEQAIEMLRSTPGTNQAVIEIAQPSDINLPDPPCLRLIQFKAANGVLHMSVYFRSWDLWAGLPTNLGGLQMLKEYVAAEAGLKDGTITASSPGAHVYDYVWDHVLQLTRVTVAYYL